MNKKFLWLILFCAAIHSEKTDAMLTNVAENISANTHPVLQEKSIPLSPINTHPEMENYVSHTDNENQSMDKGLSDENMDQDKSFHQNLYEQSLAQGSSFINGAWNAAYNMAPNVVGSMASGLANGIASNVLSKDSYLNLGVGIAAKSLGKTFAKNALNQEKEPSREEESKSNTNSDREGTEDTVYNNAKTLGQYGSTALGIIASYDGKRNARAWAEKVSRQMFNRNPVHVDNPEAPLPQSNLDKIDDADSLTDIDDPIVQIPQNSIITQNDLLFNQTTEDDQPVIHVPKISFEIKTFNNIKS